MIGVIERSIPSRHRELLIRWRYCASSPVPFLQGPDGLLSNKQTKPGGCISVSSWAVTLCGDLLGLASPGADNRLRLGCQIVSLTPGHRFLLVLI